MEDIVKLIIIAPVYIFIIVSILSLFLAKFFYKFSKSGKLEQKFSNYQKCSRYILPFIRKRESGYERRYVIANKNCVITYENPPNRPNKLICKDKNSKEIIEIFYENSSKPSNMQREIEKFWGNILCKEFGYDTDFRELKNLFTENFSKEKIRIYQNDMDISLIDINNASVAELTSIPGINAAKANKIAKHVYLEGNFKSFKEFINFASVSEEAARNILLFPKFKKLD